MKNHLIAMIIAALPAHAMATTLPAGTSPEQARQVQDWQLYATACRGGLLDEANRDNTLGYCGVARYLMFRLGQSGLCTEDGRDWRACPPQGEDPLEGFPF